MSARCCSAKPRSRFSHWLEIANSTVMISARDTLAINNALRRNERHNLGYKFEFMDALANLRRDSIGHRGASSESTNPDFRHVELCRQVQRLGQPIVDTHNYSLRRD